MYVLAPNQTVETFPYSIGDLRRDNPNTSFPRGPSNECLASWNVFPVVDRPKPSFDPATENCNPVNPTYENGEWVVNWQVTPADADEIAQRLAYESESVRDQRNLLLVESDWTQLTDSPLTGSILSSWVTYRQELRDLTTQAGFPWTISWPTPPS